MDKVPFLEVGSAYSELRIEIDEALSRVLRSGRYILGEEVEKFEATWASYCEASFAVGVGNGLDALRIALAAAGVGPGDEVIVPAHTFIATWFAVDSLGATVVPAEPHEMTMNIDPSKIEALITSRTKAIVPVHLYGQPADLDPILEIAKANKLLVVEDAAQAHGARYKGKRIGGHGDVVAWSFYPGKNLGAVGDAGAITTNNSDLADRARLLGNYGSSEKYVHSIRGLNSRLDALQATVLNVKLQHLDAWNQRRSYVAEKYRRYIGERSGDKPLLVHQAVSEFSSPVWHLFVVRSGQRDALKDFLGLRGIETVSHYPTPAHRQPAFAKYEFPDMPITDRVSSQVLSLPLGPHLSESQAQRVLESLDFFVGA